MERGQYPQSGGQIARFADGGSPLQKFFRDAELLAAFKHYGERLLRHSQIGSEPERLRIGVS
jgi:hypothetical protein